MIVVCGAVGVTGVADRSGRQVRIAGQGGNCKQFVALVTVGPGVVWFACLYSPSAS